MSRKEALKAKYPWLEAKEMGKEESDLLQNLRADPVPCTCVKCNEKRQNNSLNK